MTDFSPLLSNPKLMLFGAAAQFGIFVVTCVIILTVLILNKVTSNAPKQ